jgi:hypothetical protein
LPSSGLMGGGALMYMCLTLGSVSEVKQWSDCQGGVRRYPVATTWLLERGNEKCFSGKIVPRSEEGSFRDPVFRTRGNERFVLFFSHMNRKVSSVAVGWRWFSGGFGGEEVKPGFTQFVPSSWLKLGKCFVISVDPLMMQGQLVRMLAIKSQLHLWHTA